MPGEQSPIFRGRRPIADCSQRQAERSRRLSEGARRAEPLRRLLRPRCRSVHLPQGDSTPPSRTGYGHRTFLRRGLKSTRRTQSTSRRAGPQNLCPLIPGRHRQPDLSKYPSMRRHIPGPRNVSCLARKPAASRTEPKTAWQPGAPAPASWCGVRRRTVWELEHDVTDSLSAGQSPCGIS